MKVREVADSKPTASWQAARSAQTCLAQGAGLRTGTRQAVSGPQEYDGHKQGQHRKKKTENDDTVLKLLKIFVEEKNFDSTVFKDHATSME